MNEIETRFIASVRAPDVKPYQGWSPCINWCLGHLGDDGWWFIGDGVFEFIHEQDYLMFVLRWS